MLRTPEPSADAPKPMEARQEVEGETGEMGASGEMGRAEVAEEESGDGATRRE